MSRAQGFALAGGSVLLVSAAQLGMRWSMTRLPLPAQWLDTLVNGPLPWLALGMVMAAIFAYALSML